MPSLLLRLLKRLAILIPVLLVAYLSVFKIFPWLDNTLPILLAVIATYVIGAYLLIPAFIRLGRILVPTKHLPVYCITRDGFASDPLNVALIGTRQEVIAAMRSINWFQAEKLTLRSAYKTVINTLRNRDYITAPMSKLYLFGRQQDLSFQLEISDNSPGSRHHVRFWATSYQEDKTLSVRTINWQRRRAHVRGDKLLWVGAASRDVGITFIRHNAQLTHLVHPDTDAERNLIAKQLQAADQATLHRTIKLQNPYRLLNVHALRGHVESDGRMAILELKP